MVPTAPNQGIQALGWVPNMSASPLATYLNGGGSPPQSAGMGLRPIEPIIARSLTNGHRSPNLAFNRTRRYASRSRHADVAAPRLT